MALVCETAWLIITVRLLILRIIFPGPPYFKKKPRMGRDENGPLENSEEVLRRNAALWQTIRRLLSSRQGGILTAFTICVPFLRFQTAPYLTSS